MMDSSRLMDEASRFPSDDELFVGRHDQREQSRVGRRDATVTVSAMGAITLGVDFGSQNMQMFQRHLPHRGGVFTDAAGEYQRIDVRKRSAHRENGFRQSITKHL